MTSYTNEDRELLERPAFAVLTTLGADGSPQSTVMWFRLVDDEVRMIAPAASVKARHIARDGRVTVVVTDPGNGYAYVGVRGLASLIHDDAAARAELRQIAARYIGDAAGRYVESLSADPRVLIVIRADQISGRHSQPPG
ncbi:MAG TPA: PPOX class F420-dependent oxidoreductase [Thermomicrobiales bacterium]|jgi:PPOX class probable F420-dependent enzyme|nr:PPOX class F420-dependent oxidoreductase [Chloroflexota bacterium]HQZ90417.1 PPOX class F420-dependent oxidoreductase [Thermomicrobiales bacterium]HRA32200.1 PPOX class F420-dependent oxidoreductase [Thermomicrobiales bacterium]